MSSIASSMPSTSGCMAATPAANAARRVRSGSLANVSSVAVAALGPVEAKSCWATRCVSGDGSESCWISVVMRCGLFAIAAETAMQASANAAPSGSQCLRMRQFEHAAGAELVDDLLTLGVGNLELGEVREDWFGQLGRPRSMSQRMA